MNKKEKRKGSGSMTDNDFESELHKSNEIPEFELDEEDDAETD